MPDKAIFGRYWPGASPVHCMDPRAKLLLSLAFIIVVFCAQTPLGLAVCAAFTIGFYLAASIPLTQALRSIAPLLFIVVVTMLLNLFFVQGGAVLVEWWVIRISQQGVATAAFMGCRLLLLLLGVSLLTLATASLDVTEAFERVLGPLSRLRVPVHELSMIMGIALRFLPQFAAEASIIYRAQVSRGATFSANPLRGGAAMVSSLMVPLFTSAFRHAETLSLAMEARCYHGANGRTRLHPLAFTRLDARGAVVLAAMFVLVMGANLLPVLLS